tara:strand:- start:820 stop:1236 length:417 start_codon:yes stop_codon:yes gene_type:complete
VKFYISSEKIKKINKEIKQYINFLLAGLPSASIAIPLNILLVEVGKVNKPFSYAIVIFFQILLNFCLINKYVFKNKKDRFIISSFLKFFFGILIFRILDWFIYIQLLSLIPNLYVIIQLVNITIFSMIKFKFTKFILN